jgi:hypothetical protein
MAADSAQMIAKMRRIEDALPPELEQLVILQKRDTLPNGTIINYYEIPDGKRPPGYLWIQYQPETKEVLAAEMDVNFSCLIGLNRSPIELRLLANHVLKYLA